MLLKKNTDERSVSCYESGSPSKITPITYLSSELTRASNRTVASNTKSYVYYVNTEITDTVDRQWCLQVTTSGGAEKSSYKTTGVTRQCAPNLVLVECFTDSSYLLSYEYNLSDKGFTSGTLTNYLCDSLSEQKTNLSDTPISNSTGTGVEGTLQATVTGWETKTVAVKMVSVVTGLYAHTKTYYSNAIIVYQVSPTVAYRQNHLGINTNTPASGAIIDIHQSTGRETILIQGLDASSNPTKFEINVSTGVIKFYHNNTLKNTIDLLNGILK